MGIFGRLFGRERTPTDDILDSISRSTTSLSTPTDHDLMRQAEQSHGHISLKAVSDEYNRLVQRKYGRR